MNNLVYPIDTVQHSSISQKVETHLIDSNNDGLNLLYEGPKDINNILASKIKNYNIELKKNHSKFIKEIKKDAINAIKTLLSDFKDKYFTDRNRTICFKLDDIVLDNKSNSTYLPINVYGPYYESFSAFFISEDDYGTTDTAPEPIFTLENIPFLSFFNYIKGENPRFKEISKDDYNTIFEEFAERDKKNGYFRDFMAYSPFKTTFK